MQRRILTCLLSVFLLLMQHEAMRHALDHVGARLQRIEHSMLERPTGETCAECGLLAGGSTQLVGAPIALATSAASWHVADMPFAAPVVVAVSYYQSRAPPALLQYA